MTMGPGLIKFGIFLLCEPVVGAWHAEIKASGIVVELRLHVSRSQRQSMREFLEPRQPPGFYNARDYWFGSLGGPDQAIPDTLYEVMELRVGFLPPPSLFLFAHTDGGSDVTKRP